MGKGKRKDAMPIDAAAAVAAPPRATAVTWTPKDVILYHLGIGAGADPADAAGLRYTYERDLQVLPGFCAVAGGGSFMAAAVEGPGLDIDLASVLHGSQRIEVHRPLPPAGEAAVSTRVAAVLDKGTAAVVVLRAEARDARGPLWTSESELFVRGEGGFGGERGSRPRVPAPDRSPDAVVERPTRPGQALLYRLSGDWNPLHADPGFAARAGFDRPILHGLCTYGIVLKAVVDTALGGDAGRVRACSARFAGVFFPGETLRIRLWDDGERILGAAEAVERGGAPVLTDVAVTARRD